VTLFLGGVSLSIATAIHTPISIPFVIGFGAMFYVAVFGIFYYDIDISM
jgi:hypothetical protein